MRRRLRCLSSLSCSPFERKKRRLRSSLNMPDRCIEVWNRFSRASGSSPSLRLTNAKYILPYIEMLDICRAPDHIPEICGTTGNIPPAANIAYHMAKYPYNDQHRARRLHNPLSLKGEGWGEGDNGLIASYRALHIHLWIPAYAGMTDLCNLLTEPLPLFHASTFPGEKGLDRE